MWLSSCGREILCVCYIIPHIYIESHSTALLRVKLHRCACSLRHYVIGAHRPAWMTSQPRSWLTTPPQTHDPWPRRILTTAHQGRMECGPSLPKTLCVSASVCVFVREKTLGCEVTSVLAVKLRPQQLSQVPGRRMGKTWLSFTNKHSNRHVRTNVHTCLPQHVDCAAKAAE